MAETITGGAVFPSSNFRNGCIELAKALHIEALTSKRLTASRHIQFLLVGQPHRSIKRRKRVIRRRLSRAIQRIAILPAHEFTLIIQDKSFDGESRGVLMPVATLVLHAQG